MFLTLSIDSMSTFIKHPTTLIVAMEIETGRFENLRIEKRICCFCSDFLEDETHVLLNCPFYDDYRENLFNVAKSYTVDFMS